MPTHLCSIGLRLRHPSVDISQIEPFSSPTQPRSAARSCEERLERAVQPQVGEPALLRVGLDPVAALRDDQHSAGQRWQVRSRPQDRRPGQLAGSFRAPSLAIWTSALGRGRCSRRAFMWLLSSPHLPLGPADLCSAVRSRTPWCCDGIGKVALWSANNTSRRDNRAERCSCCVPLRVPLGTQKVKRASSL